LFGVHPHWVSEKANLRKGCLSHRNLAKADPRSALDSVPCIAALNCSIRRQSVLTFEGEILGLG